MNIDDSNTTSQPEARQKSGRLTHPPANYTDLETDGIVIPHNSPVYNKPERQKKTRIKERFAPMRESYFRMLKDSEFVVFAAMLVMGGWRGDVGVYTRPEIEEMTGKKKRTIDNAIEGLKRKGFIVRMPSPFKKGARWKVNTELTDITMSSDHLDLLEPEEKEFTAQKFAHETEFTTQEFAHPLDKTYRQIQKSKPRPSGHLLASPANDEGEARYGFDSTSAARNLQGESQKQRRSVGSEDEEPIHDERNNTRPPLHGIEKTKEREAQTKNQEQDKVLSDAEMDVIAKAQKRLNRKRSQLGA